LIPKLDVAGSNPVARFFHTQHSISFDPSRFNGTGFSLPKYSMARNSHETKLAPLKTRTGSGIALKDRRQAMVKHICPECNSIQEGRIVALIKHAAEWQCFKCLKRWLVRYAALLAEYRHDGKA